MNLQTTEIEKIKQYLEIVRPDIKSQRGQCRQTIEELDGLIEKLNIILDGVELG